MVIIEGFERMEARFCCFVLAFQLVGFVSATSRPVAANQYVGVNQSGQGPQASSTHLGSNVDSNPGPKQLKKSKEGTAGIDEEAYFRGLGRLGSSPPSCDHKCYSCNPCEAIQVPTITKRTKTHLDLNYANYEPEHWKCKCGPYFYSP